LSSSFFESEAKQEIVSPTPFMFARRGSIDAQPLGRYFNNLEPLPHLLHSFVDELRQQKRNGNLRASAAYNSNVVSPSKKLEERATARPVPNMEGSCCGCQHHR